MNFKSKTQRAKRKSFLKGEQVSLTAPSISSISSIDNEELIKQCGGRGGTNRLKSIEEVAYYKPESFQARKNEFMRGSGISSSLSVLPLSASLVVAPLGVFEAAPSPLELLPSPLVPYSQVVGSSFTGPISPIPGKSLSSLELHQSPEALSKLILESIKSPLLELELLPSEEVKPLVKMVNWSPSVLPQSLPLSLSGQDEVVMGLQSSQDSVISLQESYASQDPNLTSPPGSFHFSCSCGVDKLFYKGKEVPFIRLHYSTCLENISPLILDRIHWKRCTFSCTRSSKFGLALKNSELPKGHELCASPSQSSESFASCLNRTYGTQFLEFTCTKKWSLAMDILLTALQSSSSPNSSYSGSRSSSPVDIAHCLVVGQRALALSLANQSPSLLVLSDSDACLRFSSGPMVPRVMDDSYLLEPPSSFDFDSFVSAFLKRQKSNSTGSSGFSQLTFKSLDGLPFGIALRNLTVAIALAQVPFAHPLFDFLRNANSKLVSKNDLSDPSKCRMIVLLEFLFKLFTSAALAPIKDSILDKLPPSCIGVRNSGALTGAVVVQVLLNQEGKCVEVLDKHDAFNRTNQSDVIASIASFSKRSSRALASLFGDFHIKTSTSTIVQFGGLPQGANVSPLSQQLAEHNYLTKAFGSADLLVSPQLESLKLSYLDDNFTGGHISESIARFSKLNQVLIASNHIINKSKCKLLSKSLDSASFKFFSDQGFSFPDATTVLGFPVGCSKIAISTLIDESFLPSLQNSPGSLFSKYLTCLQKINLARVPGALLNGRKLVNDFQSCFAHLAQGVQPSLIIPLLLRVDAASRLLMLEAIGLLWLEGFDVTSDVLVVTMLNFNATFSHRFTASQLLIVRNGIPHPSTPGWVQTLQRVWGMQANKNSIAIGNLVLLAVPIFAARQAQVFPQASIILESECKVILQPSDLSGFPEALLQIQLLFAEVNDERNPFPESLLSTVDMRTHTLTKLCSLFSKKVLDKEFHDLSKQILSPIVPHLDPMANILDDSLRTSFVAKSTREAAAFLSLNPFLHQCRLPHQVIQTQLILIMMIPSLVNTFDKGPLPYFQAITTSPAAKWNGASVQTAVQSALKLSSGVTVSKDLGSSTGSPCQLDKHLSRVTSSTVPSEPVTIVSSTLAPPISPSPHLPFLTGTQVSSISNLSQPTAIVSHSEILPRIDSQGTVKVYADIALDLVGLPEMLLIDVTRCGDLDKGLQRKYVEYRHWILTGMVEGIPQVTFWTINMFGSWGKQAFRLLRLIKIYAQRHGLDIKIDSGTIRQKVAIATAYANYNVLQYAMTGLKPFASLH